MTGLIVNMISALFLVAAIGILGLVIYRGVANAYRETVLAEAEGKGAQAPKHGRYGHFLWRLVYPVLAVFGIIIKILIEFLPGNAESRQQECWHGGAYWKRGPGGAWYSLDADDDTPEPPLFR